MFSKHILILGSGHLAYRIENLIKQRTTEYTHITSEEFRLKQKDGAMYDSLAAVLNREALQNISMVYIVDDKDEFNLEMIISLMALRNDLPVTASLFNENIIPHLLAGHPNLHIVNPAKIAAPYFVQALYTNVVRTLPPVESNHTDKTVHHKDNLIKILLVSFACIIILATAYFCIAENLSFIDSLYFVIVTVATVGYGDINLLNSHPATKVAGIILILSSTVFIWLIFSLTIDRIIKSRVQLALGRKRYNYKDHIIICGLGRLGFFIAKELIEKNEKIVIIEPDENCVNIDYFRARGVDVYIGNARLPHVLKDTGAANARAVISVVDDDYANLEIGLSARSFQPGLRLILRIFDAQMADKIKETLDIHLTLSMSALADDEFAKFLKEVV